jgi:hypothetical protein
MSISANVSYSPGRYRRARLGILIMALLGLLSLAAVREMAGECRTEQACIGLENGGCLGAEGGGFIAANGKTTRCALTAGGWLRLELSEQTVDTLRRLGSPISTSSSPAP